MPPKFEVCVIGGAGHVGVPLSLVLADRGVRTLICDVNARALGALKEGRLPFLEDEGTQMLARVLKAGSLGFTGKASDIRGVPVVILTIGTPIDEFHNPKFSAMTKCLDGLIPHLEDGQTVILRSTVAPGMVEFIDGYIKSQGCKARLAYCPERVVQGRGIVEIQGIPQLVSATSAEALATAKALFSRIAPEVIEVTPAEAELGKLICNAYRYIGFAATNQLYMLVESAGVDYNHLLRKMKQDYPRLDGIPGPGFAAGPCLMKDTMQLFSMGKHRFPLGQMAVAINEGMPEFVLERLLNGGSLKGRTVGILGMAFKSDSDDIRESLSYKLRKLLRLHSAKVLCSDEFVEDQTFVSKEELVSRCEIVIVGVPHTAYRRLCVPARTRVVDLWGVLGGRTGERTGRPPRERALGSSRRA